MAHATLYILPAALLAAPAGSYARQAPDETQAMDADAAAAAEEKAHPRADRRKRDHHRQGFVNVMVGTGYFLVAPYNKDSLTERCQASEDNPMKGEPLCSGRTGWHLDFLAGYGLRPGFELFAIFRLGLEQPDNDGLLNQPKIRQLGVGLKIYSPSSGLFKVGFGAAALVDFSNRGAGGVRNDFIIHVPIQAQFDVLPWFGPYAQIAPNISFISEFRLEFTGGIGVQGRFP